MPISLTEYLNGLVNILKEDFSFHLEKVKIELKDLVCFQQLEKEAVIIEIENNEISIKKPEGYDQSNIKVFVTKESFFKIIDGDCTLIEAFNNKSLEVTGSANDLVIYYKVLERLLKLSRTSPRFLFLTRQLKS